MRVRVLGFLLAGRTHPAALVVKPPLALVARDHRPSGVVRRLAQAVHLAPLAQLLELLLEIDAKRAALLHESLHRLHGNVARAIHGVSGSVQPRLSRGFQRRHLVAERIRAGRLTTRNDHTRRHASLAEIRQRRQRGEPRVCIILAGADGSLEGRERGAARARHASPHTSRSR